MLYDLQKVENGFIKTDMVTTSKRRLFARLQELQNRRQHCRVLDRLGNILEPEEIHEMR